MVYKLFLGKWRFDSSVGAFIAIKVAGVYYDSTNNLGSLEIVGPKYGTLHFVDGYTYTVNKFIGERRYLKCVESRKLNCKGTLVLILNEEPRLNGKHNHPPDYSLGTKYQILKALKDTAHHMCDSSPIEIYNIMVDVYNETKKLFPFDKVKNMIKRQSKLAMKMRASEVKNRELM